jgi:hypothetical protein
VGAQLQKGSGTWGGGRETRDVDASMVGRVRGQLGRTGLRGGVHGSTEGAHERAGGADRRGHADREIWGNGCARDRGNQRRQAVSTAKRERERGRARARANWADWAERLRERVFGLLWLFFLNQNF